MYAAKKGLVEILNILLYFNPKIDIKDKLGRTALFYSIDNSEFSENIDIVQRLIENNC